MMAYNYSKLRGKIVEKYGSQEAFAQAVKLSKRSISFKLNNKVPFNQLEIDAACRVLDIPSKEIGLYFFTPQVQ